MRSLHSTLFRCLFTLGLALTLTRSAAADFVDLEDLALPGPNSFVNNPSGTTAIGVPVMSAFTSRGATFNNTFERLSFGGSLIDVWSGWSYSNVTDVTTPGVGNQYSAFNVPAGGGAGGSANYAVAFAFSPGDASIDLPPGTAPVSVEITNTTFAALSIRDGDPFARPFGPGDFFKLTIRGFDDSGNETGLVDFFLADFRDGSSTIIDRWTAVDLTPLGAAARLSFGLESTDVGPFGMNTPAYFALDNLQVSADGPEPPSAVPEPGTFGLAAVGAAALLAARYRRKRAGAARR